MKLSQVEIGNKITTDGKVPYHYHAHIKEAILNVQEGRNCAGCPREKRNPSIGFLHGDESDFRQLIGNMESKIQGLSAKAGRITVPLYNEQGCVFQRLVIDQ